MNALVSLDSILEPQQALTATALFGSGQVETILKAIEADVRAEVYDLATEEGRERIKSVAYKIARSKTTLDEIGKEHVAVIKEQSAKIDKERKALRDRLDALKEEVRAPLTAWETAEADRIALHESALVFLAEATRFASPPTVATIKERIESVRAACVRDWQEFAERAEVIGGEAGYALATMLFEAEQRERDAAELEQLRREKAERDAKDAERERAQAVRLEAERKAEAERIREEQRKKEQEAAVARAREEEQRKAAEAIERARQAERQRIEQEARDALAKKAAEDAVERKRQENRRHRDKVHAQIAAALQKCGLPAAASSELLDVIVAGKIPHVSINY